MKCSVDGCYAKSFHKNMCRGHYDLWLGHLPAAPGFKKGVLRGAPAPTTRRSRERYQGPCRCPHPKPQPVVWWGCFECGNCGMPLPTERISDGTSRTANME